ncbi:helix-turn-helix protein [Ruminiclostridium sufflavum DSM 19573]|uniref:Helix-turn-helix protein n=1 Tax=Ruminiclostridium sufflavum DSM 19573 TaxID=1121337 RepID=A0A318XR28_9FIRM|nr:helix-turn-helix transcriptional regulator [Ruminiclostridium sufflavum]PYG88462.1 helix-turn-helix protein [Ruminiclostridium sufflavum DSM 19573]
MLSENLALHLKSRKISVYKFSKLSNVPQSTIRDILAGRSKSTSYENLAKMASALNLSMNELSGEEEVKLEGCYLEVAKIAQDKKIDPKKILDIINLIEGDK